MMAEVHARAGVIFTEVEIMMVMTAWECGNFLVVINIANIIYTIIASCRYHLHQSIIAILSMCFSCFSQPPHQLDGLALSLTLLFVIGD